MAAYHWLDSRGIDILLGLGQPVIRYVLSARQAKTDDFEEVMNRIQPKDTPVTPAARFSFAAPCTMRRGQRRLKAQMVNISESGSFIETQAQLFELGEKIAVNIQPAGYPRAFDVIAQVVRFNNDPQYPLGYGLKFFWPHQVVKPF